MEGRGFTLIELLVVVAIIGVLSSVVLASLNSTRVKARNTSRVELVLQYQRALELAYSVNGSYPMVGVTPVCLGAYSNNTCNNGAFSTSATLDAAISPHIQLTAPPSEGNPSTDRFLYSACIPGENGYCPWFTNTGRPLPDYYIHWYMEGTNQSCRPGLVYTPAFLGRYTSCLLPSN
jgi:prepilin-type N-terminal cleavage/methylation domain-containing protein